jgi:AraC-like DNA-binding protein
MQNENSTIIKEVKLSALLEQIYGTQYADEIVILDNFEKPNHYIGYTPYPVKLQFNLSIFLLEGSLSVCIGHEEYTLKPYDWIHVMKDKMYQTIYISPDAKIGVCCMDEGFYDFSPEKIKAIELYNQFSHSPIVSLSEENVEEYLNTFKNIKKYLSLRNHKCRSEILRGYCNILFLVLCSEILKNNYLEKRRFTRKEAIYHEFLVNIERYYKKERSVKFYANKMCLTPKYLSSVIHQVSGKYASEWIDSHTILEIKALLKSTNMPVQQIAYELNFSTPAHFGKFFKRVTGISPKRYRHNF